MKRLTEFSRTREVKKEKEFFTTEMVKDAWNLAMADLMYPPLPDPEIVETREDGSGWILEDSWQIQLNNFFRPKVLSAPEEKISYLRSLFHHEAYHWILIPHDKVTSAVLVERAMRHIKDPELARFSVNIVADAIIEHNISNDFRELQEKRFQVSISHMLEMTDNKPSLLWQVIIYLFCHVAGQETQLRGLTLQSEAINAGDELVRTLKDIDNEIRWPLMVQKASKVINDLLDASSQSSSSGRGTEGGKSGGDSEKLPEDCKKAFPGQTEMRAREDIGKKRGSGKESSKQDGQEVEKIARELEKILKNFGRFGAGLTGAGVSTISGSGKGGYIKSAMARFQASLTISVVKNSFSFLTSRVLENSVNLFIAKCFLPLPGSCLDQDRS